MKKTILAFGASNSHTSINKQFAVYAANLLKGYDVNVLDLNDFVMPIFSIEYEKENGVPEPAHQFKEQIKESDGIVISFAEHNGSYSVAFKNILDWISRIEDNVWLNKPMLLLATSPGPRGGKTVLEIALSKFERMNENAIVGFSLPSFNQNFKSEEGVTNPEFLKELQNQLRLFKKAIDK